MENPEEKVLRKKSTKTGHEATVKLKTKKKPSDKEEKKNLDKTISTAHKNGYREED